MSRNRRRIVLMGALDLGDTISDSTWDTATEGGWLPTPAGTAAAAQQDPAFAQALAQQNNTTPGDVLASAAALTGKPAPASTLATLGLPNNATNGGTLTTVSASTPQTGSSSIAGKVALFGLLGFGAFKLAKLKHMI